MRDCPAGLLQKTTGQTILLRLQNIHGQANFSHLTTFIGTVIRLFMSTPPATASAEQPAASPRQRFLRRIAALPILPAARDYYVRWAEAWTKARGNRSPDATTAFFDALGRSTHLQDWQFRQRPFSKR
jgi:hypothetical protein